MFWKKFTNINRKKAKLNNIQISNNKPEPQLAKPSSCALPKIRRAPRCKKSAPKPRSVPKKRPTVNIL